MKILRALTFSIVFLLASALLFSSSAEYPSRAAALNPPQPAGCQAGAGWRWVNGPEQPQTALQVQTALRQAGILATVQARGYGEVDLCDTYLPHGVDLFLTLPETPALDSARQTALEADIRQVLGDLPGVQIGNIQVSAPGGQVTHLRLDDPAPTPPSESALAGSVHWQLVHTAQSPSARLLHGMAFDSARGKTVLFGGDSSGYSRLSDTWEYDGVNWNLKTPAHSPAGRANIDQVLTYDSLRGSVVLFGGLGSSQYLNDTWEYNGADWSEISPSQRPAARDAHAMAFDSARGKTVLFGGYTYSGTVNDTWEYDGAWRPTNPAVKPPARYHHSMVYDQQRGVVVLFGGSTPANLLGDTWEYNGSTWTQIVTPQSPPARENHSMAYDSSRGVVVLFGGHANGSLLNDTWEYDGASWVQVTATPAPSPRGEANMVFDNLRQKVVLFGGGNWTAGFDPTAETWEYPFTGDSTGTGIINKKVYVVAYNPYVDAAKTQRVWDYFGWNSFELITANTIDFFREASGGQVRYSVADTTVLDEFPQKTDGFIYTMQGYINVINRVTPAHVPDSVDYNLIVNDPRLDICGKANRREIDEVWIFNGPYYGFWESTLVGPDSYFYNSSPVPGPFTCERMIPIMGPNPERFTSESIENFGHRTESTMRQVYNGQWEQNNPRNSWEKFALVDSLSPDYTYSGCGDVHFPPNGQSDYDWGNSISAQTYCEDFANYPELHNPTDVLQTVTCATWGCSGLSYFDWWYRHFPDNLGCGPDNVANNWWVYFAYPELALNPSQGCTLSYPNHIFVPYAKR